MASVCAGYRAFRPRQLGTTDGPSDHADATEMGAGTSLKCGSAQSRERAVHAPSSEPLTRQARQEAAFSIMIVSAEAATQGQTGSSPVRLDPFGFLVDDRFGDLGQGFVGCFLFIQRFLQQGDRFVQAQFFCPGAQCAVA